MARLDPFIDLLIKNGGEQLVLVPDEPVGMEKHGRQSKLSKQVITEKQLYALLTEMAPSEAADRIGKGTGATFEYAGGAGLVIVRVTPKNGKLHAQITPGVDAGPPANVESEASQEPAASPARISVAQEAPGGGGRKPRLSVVVAPPPAEASTNAPGALPAEFADSRLEGAQRQLGQLLRALVQSQSSDLHLRVDEPPIFRTHGEIVRHGEDPLTGEQLDLLLLSIMPERNRLEWRESGDTDFAYEIAGLARFRVNAARDRKGSVGVFRVIPANVVTVEDMGITAEVQKLCYLTKGLVLVTGPTGSGKSTTLCSLIDLINRERSDHIITIEDPIEFVHENKNCLITQRQVHVHTESFKSALRAALREDPDIVLVGEMRDLETIAIALETAETGHLVFGTLHTTTAPSTVDRIIDQFPADRQAQIRIMLSESLKGVIAQTLCKKVGGGRVAAREILLTTPAISNLIREGKTFQIPSIIQTSKKLGMITLNDALLDLVEKKMVEPDEAYMKAVEKAGFAAQLKSKGFKLTVPAEG
ncbi:MAG TPA: type IV pilus twitching motility protein PilT [Gemmatimonadales bacterium]|nr:type IV pilus twitching motility protein PilT [Gemmatimonadales bacterium]